MSLRRKLSRQPGWRSRCTAIGLGVALSLIAAVPGARGASFGVPGVGPPPGYFLLIGPDAIQVGLAWALGDIPHRMTYYIEVSAPGRLTVNLYDVGVYNPAGGLGVQLDSSFSPTNYVGEMHVALISPGLALITQRTYGADTNATNRRSVQFYDANVAAGTYQLVVELMDTAGRDEDVSVFGIGVPGHEMYAYNYCVGHNLQGGATIGDPIVLYPFVDYSLAAMEGTRPVCGLDLVNYDMDAPAAGTAPPELGLTTARGYVFPLNREPLPSANMSFWSDRLAGVPFGELDSDDQGIWRWEFRGIGATQDRPSPSLPAPYDMNAFSMQVYDYGKPSPLWQDWPYDPSFLNPIDDRHPRRLYLPRDDGTAPEKETMGHRARVIAGRDPITEGMASTVEVTFRFDNPREYDLTVLDGATYVNPSGDFSDPVLVNPGSNLRAAINGSDPKRIDLSGTVPAFSTETIVYTVDVTPTMTGIQFLTGDGNDFTGGANRPTRIRYSTPLSLIYGPDQFGPICALYYDARAAVCTAQAAITPSATQVCAGDPVTLDGSGSSLDLCPGGGTIEYQWRAGGSVILPFPAAAAVVVNPATTTTYTLDVRCSTSPTACTNSTDQLVTVFPAPLPVIGPAAPEVCAGSTVMLTLQNPGDYAWYQWTTVPAGEPGDGQTNLPTVSARLVGAVYTVTGRTADNCTRQSDVTVVERTIPAPDLNPADPAICQGRPIRLEAVGSFARCVWSTVPAGAPGDGTQPDCFVTTDQPGVQYRVTVYDALGCSSTAVVTTRAALDQVPPALGNVLRLVKRNQLDVELSWTDLAMAVGEYRLPRLEADADRDGQRDTYPTTPSLDGAPYFAVVPGVESHLQAGGVGGPSFLDYYRVRAASDCFLTPGPP